MTDIAEIFARDPLTYTKSEDELGQIIRYFREKRGQFNAGNMKAGSTKPVSEKQKAVLSIADKLDLGGLDL